MMDKQSRPPSVSSEVDDLDSTTSTKSRHASEAQSEPDAVESTRNDFKDEPKLDDIKRLESIIQSLRDTTAAQISQLRDMVTQKDKIISDLTDKLEQQRDYEEIKRELCIFRSELSHFPPVISSLEQGSDSKAFQSYLLEKSKTFPHEPLKLESEAAGAPGQSLAAVQRNAFFNPFSLPQLQSLGNVESFGTMLGEELVSSYAKALAKRDPSIFAMAAAAAASSTNGSKLNATNNQNNGNLTDSLSPSHGSNGEEAVEDKSGGSASTTPTSAMICPEGADPVNHSPLGATTVSDLGLSSFSPSPQNTTTASYDKLQQQLRYNVEKYMNENLNTLQISRYVRELLSVHNIGQRLFAKYVLGLSQGTVSELLSKPKPWDKLTEKGRDSYRKMHAWSSDERCIHLLKSLVPRKGKDTSTYKQEDPVSEERIVQILNEAQRSMHSKGISRTDFFTTPFLNGEHLQSRIERDLKASSTIENASDNGSDPDENKSDLAGNERKSPGSALNATAMATINNFYRNINESFPGDSRNRLVRPKFGGQESDEANQSDMMRIYQDHITKMIGQQLEEGLRNTHNYEDIRNVMALQQELLRANPFAVQANPELLARLFSSGLINGAGYLGNLPLGMDLPQANQMDSLRKVAQSDTQLGKEVRELNSSASEPRLKIDNLLSQLKSGGSLSPSRNGTPPAPVVSVSASMPGAPGVAFSNASETPDDLVASPLQRMQSITNSLLSQSSLPSLPSQPSRPAKAVLPPITQQQFDQYNNLNTEEIVKRVKEQLSQYSISQRLFGESVLGLSQGSVSDLLARPKPWHMLTQKGREPFIRMKMFLEDENAIHKLVASQYKIAPEKLMRTGSFVSGTGISSIAMAPTVPPQISTPPSNLSLNSLNSPVCNKNVNTHLKLTNENVYKYEQSMSPSSVDNGTRSNTSSPELNVSNPSSVPSPLLSSRSRIGGYSSINNNLLRPALNQTSAYMQPSVYELAALTSDLDTQTITTRIKETLMAHNIGQKIFGEVVLGLSQGSVSELLSKPKPWHMLSIKGREPFIRMQLWLNDPNNIEKLQTLKNERREANKRRRTHMEETLPGMKSFDNQLFNFSGNFNLGNSLNKGLLGSAGAFVGSTTGTQQPVVKKARILFTEEQKEALRIAFSMDPYPSSSTAEFLAKELNLSIRTITNWFHNHRMRLKQTSAATGEDNQTNLPYNIGRDNVSFDQNKFRSLLSQRISELKLRSNNLPHSNNSSSGSTSSHNDNSNPSYGHSFSQSSASSPPHFQQRLKYSPSMFHSQGIYSNNTNSCSSPGSSSPFQEDEEMGTLDLSMSSHNQHRLEDKLDSIGRSSVQDDSDDGCRTGEDDEEEEQVNSDDEGCREEVPSKPFRTGSSRRKPQHVMSSSSRRKAAQPQQWVAPLDTSNYDFAEDEFDGDIGDRLADDINGSHDKRSLEGEELDDQKTDEEMEAVDETCGVESDSERASPPPYKKLKSTASVMSKLAINEDSSSMMQECVQ